MHHPGRGQGPPSNGRSQNHTIKAWPLGCWFQRAWERGADVNGVEISDSMENLIEAKFDVYLKARRERRACAARSANLALGTQGLDGHEKATRRTCCVKRCTTSTCKALGVVAAVDCPHTPAHKRVLCSEHQGVAEQCAPAQKVRRLRWRNPIAKHVEDLVAVFVDNDAGSERKP